MGDFAQFTRVTIMRKVTADIQNAIKQGATFKGANTEIRFFRDVNAVHGAEVRFHGHTIAKMCPVGRVWSFNFCGYRTNTTRDRINAVRGALGLPLVSLTEFPEGSAALRAWFN